MSKAKTGIYKIVNTENDKTYIGSSVDIDRRWKEHKSRLRHDRHGNQHLSNSWDKYGEDSFELQIIELIDKEDLVVRERYYINKLQPEYNIGDVVFDLTTEGRKKFSESGSYKSGKDHPFYGKEFSKEHRKQISKGHKGKTLSPEHRKHIAEGNKGREMKPETREKISKTVSGEQNGLHGVTGVDSPVKGENNGQAKLTVQQVKQIKELLRDTNLLQREIAEKFNTTQTRVSAISRGEDWSWIKLGDDESG